MEKFIKLDLKKSTNIKEAFYNKEDKELKIIFISSKATYIYKNVEPEIVEKWKHADSVGKYYLANIKGLYNFDKIVNKTR